MHQLRKAYLLFLFINYHVLYFFFFLFNLYNDQIFNNFEFIKTDIIIVKILYS